MTWQYIPVAIPMVLFGDHIRRPCLFRLGPPPFASTLPFFVLMVGVTIWSLSYALQWQPGIIRPEFLRPD